MSPNATPNDPVAITQALVRLDTCNPCRSEAPAAAACRDMLSVPGVAVRIVEHAPGRANLLAELPGEGPRKSEPALAFTGHLDTVPLGQAEWSVPPLEGLIRDGRLHGRGSSDMKSGVAAMLSALLAVAGEGFSGRPIRLILTAGEETGNEGAFFLAREGHLEPAGALVVAEPTGNKPLLGHKGVCWLRGEAKGVAAHGSMPHLGDNAALTAARAAIAIVEALEANPARHPVMGASTVNLGQLHGGHKTNVVPDSASFELDLRLVPGQNPQRLGAGLQDYLPRELRAKVTLETLFCAPPVWTEPDHPFARAALALSGDILGESAPGAATYFTDASALLPALGDPPCLILGPGEPGQAHVVDEWCEVEKIAKAAEFYAALMRGWRRSSICP